MRLRQASTARARVTAIQDTLSRRAVKKPGCARPLREVRPCYTSAFLPAQKGTDSQTVGQPGCLKPSSHATGNSGSKFPRTHWLRHDSRRARSHGLLLVTAAQAQRAIPVIIITRSLRLPQPSILQQPKPPQASNDGNAEEEKEEEGISPNSLPRQTRLGA
jgi:hypothetical protein